MLKADFKHNLYFESFGVGICVSSNIPEPIEKVKDSFKNNLPDCVREIEQTEVEHNFLFVREPYKKDVLFKNGEKIGAQVFDENLIDGLISLVRLTVAEFAVERVFVHAGVVGWKGKAILIPARSFKGKTTLTTALIKHGALYFSDEYAVLDQDGFVHPFAKPLSIRGEIDERTQVDYAIETFGGKIGIEKIPVGMVLITEYKSNGKWKPQILSSANGILELIKNTIPIRNNPNFSLEVLQKATKHALFIKSIRGDVSKSVEPILNYFEANCL
ncbi:hypothetical protein BH10ACI1_BH10ACI1_06210 [soil metagenome]